MLCFLSFYLSRLALHLSSPIMVLIMKILLGFDEGPLVDFGRG